MASGRGEESAMKTVRSTAEAVSTHELDDYIEATAALEASEAQLVQKIKANRERIRGLLETLGKRAHVTPNLYGAELVAVVRREWDVRKLARVLSEEQFDALCPRRPEVGKLGKLLEADETLAPRLGRCAAVSEMQRLEINCPPAAAAERN
jgi:hypothetical protein